MEILNEATEPLKIVGFIQTKSIISDPLFTFLCLPIVGEWDS